MCMYNCYSCLLHLLLPVELPLGYILLPDWPARGAGKSDDPLNVHRPSVAGGSAVFLWGFKKENVSI